VRHHLHMLGEAMRGVDLAAERIRTTAMTMHRLTSAPKANATILRIRANFAP
jgi:hypothetical protein